MKIEFQCKTNSYELPHVNTAIFLYDGKRVVIDRRMTESMSGTEEGTIDMFWRSIYIWDGEKEDFNIPSDFANKAVFDCFEIEDDAPEDYYCECYAYHIYDERS